MLNLYEQIGIFIVVLIVMFIVPNLALKLSKRMKIGDTVVHFFDPPKDISILEVGYFYDTRMHFRDVLAWLIDLKKRGVIELQKQGDDVIVLTKNGFKSDLEIENKFWKSLVRENEDVTLKYILLNYNRLLLPLTFDFLKDLREKDYLQKENSWAVLFAIIFGLFIYLVGGNYLVDIPDGLLLLGLGFGGGFVSWVTLNTPKMTAKGKELYKNLLGFADFLTVAEKDREKFRQELETRKIELEDEISGVSNLEFSELIPYMIILNIDKEWYETLIPELKEFVKGEGELISTYKM